VRQLAPHRELDPRQTSHEPAKVAVPVLAVTDEQRVGVFARIGDGDEKTVGERRDPLALTERVRAASSQEDRDPSH
jgi:hypothetical protein